MLTYGENECLLSTELFNFDKIVFYATRGNNFFDEYEVGCMRRR